LVYEFMGSLPEWCEAIERSSSDGPSCEDEKSRLYLVHPGCGCGCEMKDLTWLARKPRLHLCLIVRGVVALDQEDFSFRVCLADESEEIQTALVLVAVLAFAD
jgi:hypothetical protein